MQYFGIAMTALLVLTQSPKDCEDGYFTGYLVTLTMFSVCIFFTLLCFAIPKYGLKLETGYYLKFFLIGNIVNLVLLFINFLSNAFSGNDCGVYSVRGFAAGLIAICSFGSVMLIALIEVLILGYDWCNDKLIARFNRGITSTSQETALKE